MRCAKLIHWRLPAFIVFLLIIGNIAGAQQEKYISLTIKDGLPSNNIYRCLEDDNGFLWVATDAGLARFDGKHFQVFTKKDGLPDDEVLSIIKEKNGTIWVNCFKQGPTFFDNVKNRFVKAMDKENTARFTSTLNMFLFALEDGGVIYINDKASVVFKDKKMVVYPNDQQFTYFFIRKNKNGSRLWMGGRRDKDNNPVAIGLYSIKNHKIVESDILFRKAESLFVTIDNGKLYVCQNKFKLCYIYSDFKTEPIRYKTDSIAIPEPFVNMLFTPTSLYFIGRSGKIYIYNKQTLKPSGTLQGNYLANSYYDDSKGNIWISTIDKGLILYKKKLLQSVNMPGNNLQTNFLSIAKKKDGTLLAGNYYGEVVETKNGKSTVHAITKMVASKVRKILVYGDDIYTFSEEGTFYNYKTPLINPYNKKLHRSKTALFLNNETIIIGTHFGLDALNIRTKEIKNLNPKHLRITALAKKDSTSVYFGSLNGLYKYDVAKNNYLSLGYISEPLNDKIASLCYAKDSLLWVSVSGIGLIALKDNKVLPLVNIGSTIYTNEYRSIISFRKGQIWASSPRGINVINYQLKGNKVYYSSSNITSSDGLASNDVRDMIYQDKQLYIATSNGISIIPGDFSLPKFDIPTYLISMSVNQRDTILASDYHLKYNQKNVQMKFAGVSLSGHLKYLQYTINKDENWVNLDENTLTIQLSSGQHTLQVRAVDVSGNVSSRILTIKFDVATPFWKSVWFWAIIGIVFQGLVIYLINRRQKKLKELGLIKKLAAVQTAALEQQAFTSLMNPHFIFNALNSIQHYINVQDRQNANRYLSDFASLIRKNFEASQNSFIPLEEEIENIKLYLRLEQMRFNDSFTYKISINANVEVEDWMIPTMILQPLLENALLHGLMPSKIPGKLSISFEEQNENLLIAITDNGIGLINSGVLKSGTLHKSRGMELIRKRIKALNSFDSHHISIIMEPAFKSVKNPGNKISFLIPFTMHQAWLKLKYPKIPETH